MTEPEQGALAVAALGVRVFAIYGINGDSQCTCKVRPCPNAGKHPMQRGWQRLASTDEATIRRWARSWPGCNFAMLGDDVVTVDVDPQNGGSLEAVRSLGWVPATNWVTRTGGGGWHLCYAAPPTPVGNAKLAPGIDLKATGGYVVAPGSMHSSGRRYESVALPAAAAAVVPWPTDGPQRHQDAGPGTSDRSHLTQLLGAPAAVGGRNDWLAQVAGHYAKAFRHEDAYRLHVAQANTLLPEPLEADEVAKLSTSIWTAEQGQAANPSPDVKFEKDVAAEVRRLQVRAEATKRLRAEAEVELPATEHLAEFIAQDDEPLHFAVEDLLAQDGNALLAAQYKAGKTTLQRNLARAFIDAAPFLGRFKCEPLPEGRTVAIWDLEMTEPQSRDWWRRMRLVHPERVWPLHLKGLRMELDRDNRKVVETAVAWLTERNVHVWLIDPFARVFGGEEWDNPAAGRLTDAIDEIKERAGVSVVCLAAHFGRKTHEQGAEHARGPTRLDDWADARWVLTREQEDRFFAADGRDVEILESRVFFDKDTLTMTLGEGSRRTRSRDKLEEAILQYLVGLQKVGGEQLRAAVTRKAIEAAVPGRASAIGEALQVLVNKGAIVVRMGPQQQRWHYLSTHPEAAQEVLA
jgi:hypothetical protein